MKSLRLIIYENLSRYRGEVGKSEEVDQPNRDHQTQEWVLGDEVDRGEVDCEEKTDDGHQHSELHVVQQPPPYCRIRIENILEKLKYFENIYVVWRDS